MQESAFLLVFGGRLGVLLPVVLGFVAEAANPQVVAGDGQCGAEECCEEGDDFCDYSTPTSGVNLVDCTPYACCTVVTAASWCSFGCFGFAMVAMPSHAFSAAGAVAFSAAMAGAIEGFGGFVVMVAGCCHLFGGGATVTSGACINAQHGVEAGAIP